MKLIPANEMTLYYHKRTNLLEVLEEFDRSGFHCVEVQDYLHASAKNCCASFKNAINRYRMYNIDVFARGTKVFLVKVNEN